MVNQLIKLSIEVKETLDELKIHPRETYDDIIRRLLNGKLKTLNKSKKIKK